MGILNLGENDSALTFYDDIIFNSSGKDDSFRQIKARALFYKAIALKRKGDIQQAQKELSGLALQPDYQYIGLALLELGQIYYEQGEYELAKRTCERADRETIDANITIRVALLLGAIYLELKDWSKAVNYYDKAEKLANNCDEIFVPKKQWYINESLYKKGISLVKSQRSAEAIPPLISFIAISKKDVKLEQALFWLAEAYYRSDLLKNSIEAYNSLLETFPSTSRREEILYGLGWAYFRLRDFKNSSDILIN